MRMCKQCRYWHEELTQCRVDPPQIEMLSGTSRGVAMWPATVEDDWCGSFEEINDGYVEKDDQEDEVPYGLTYGDKFGGEK